MSLHYIINKAWVVQVMINMATINTNAVRLMIAQKDFYVTGFTTMNGNKALKLELCEYEELIKGERIFFYYGGNLIDFKWFDVEEHEPSNELIEEIGWEDDLFYKWSGNDCLSINGEYIHSSQVISEGRYVSKCKHEDFEGKAAGFSHENGHSYYHQCTECGKTTQVWTDKDYEELDYDPIQREIEKIQAEA